MPYVLNAVTAPDNYTAAATIENVPIDSLILNVTNQAILWQLKIGTGGGSGVWDDTETLTLPGSTPISSDTPGEIVGIRFRAFTKAAQIPSGSSQAVVSVRTSP